MRAKRGFRRAAAAGLAACGVAIASLGGCGGSASTPTFGDGDAGAPSAGESGGSSAPGQSASSGGGATGAGDSGSAGATGATGAAGSSGGPGGAGGGAAAGSSSSSSSGGSSGGAATGSSGGPGAGGSSGAGASDGGPGAGMPRDGGARADASTLVDASVTLADGGTFDQFQQHNLDVVNGYRTQAGLKPYVLDATLSAFALAGSVELSMDHMAHQHFMNASANKTLFTAASGFRSSAGENQGDPNGWTVTSMDPTMNELTQIDQIQAAMFAEGPSGGHYQNQMSTTFTRMGVGLLEVSGKLYLTNDFSN